MNSKTAKLIRRYAVKNLPPRERNHKRTYRKLKLEWLATPRNARQFVRANLEAMS